MDTDLWQRPLPPTPGELRQAEAAMADLVPDAQWQVYASVLQQARDRGLRFAVGGGLAFSLYSGHPRNTKDMDIFIVPGDHQEFIDLMHRAGYEEYRAVPYDPTWSYRGHQDGYIMDVLWRMLNDRAPVDEQWIQRGWDLQIRGVPLRLISVEELMWAKLYILHRERCDWPDILVLLYARGPQMDWGHLLGRLGDDAPVFGGLLHLFRWMCPGRAARLPSWIWGRLGLTDEPLGGPEVDYRRVALLNSSEWFPKGETVCRSVQ
jgi:hypothetical protein